MNSQIIGLRVACVVFGLIAIAQLVRLSDTPRGARGRSSDAVVAKCAGLHHFERSESLDVETCAHADQMNEIGIRHGRAMTLPSAANTRTGVSDMPKSRTCSPCLFVSWPVWRNQSGLQIVFTNRATVKAMSRAENDLHELVQAGYRYALALTHHHYDAEDLVQQAWLKLTHR